MLVRAVQLEYGSPRDLIGMHGLECTRIAKEHTPLNYLVLGFVRLFASGVLTFKKVLLCPTEATLFQSIPMSPEFVRKLPRTYIPAVET